MPQRAMGSESVLVGCTQKGERKRCMGPGSCSDWPLGTPPFLAWQSAAPGRSMGFALVPPCTMRCQPYPPITPCFSSVMKAG